MTIETKVSMKEKIMKLIAERLDKKLEQITDETTLNKLGADSLDFYELVLSLEEEYGIEIKDYEKMKNIGEFVHYVENEYIRNNGGEK